MKRQIQTFMQELSKALASADLKLLDLPTRVPTITAETVEAWRRGDLEPRPSDVRSLEKALSLPAGSLARHLGYIFLAGSQRVDPVLLDAEAAAEYLAVNKRYLYRLTYEHRITHVKFGSLLRFRKSDLDAYIEQRLHRARS